MCPARSARAAPWGDLIRLGAPSAARKRSQAAAARERHGQPPVADGSTPPGESRAGGGAASPASPAGSRDPVSADDGGETARHPAAAQHVNTPPVNHHRPGTGHSGADVWAVTVCELLEALLFSPLDQQVLRSWCHVAAAAPRRHLPAAAAV